MLRFFREWFEPRGIRGLKSDPLESKDTLLDIKGKAQWSSTCRWAASTGGVPFLKQHRQLGATDFPLHVEHGNLRSIFLK